MFTLAVFDNSIEFEADTAEIFLALYNSISTILCNVF